MRLTCSGCVQPVLVRERQNKVDRVHDEDPNVRGGTEWPKIAQNLRSICSQAFPGAFLPQAQGVPVNPHVQRVQNMYMAKGGGESLRPSYGRPKLTLISRGKTNLKQCSKKLAGHNFDSRAKSSWEKNFNIYKNFLSGGFRSTIKIVAS